MGRLGGGEVGYGSDADVLFVHEPVEGAEDAVAQDQALATVQELRRLLGGAGPDTGLGLDADLRPEGKSGPLVAQRSPAPRLLPALVARPGSRRPCCGPRPSPGTSGWGALRLAHRPAALARRRPHRRPGP